MEIQYRYNNNNYAAYAFIDNEDVLREEVEKFRQMACRARERGILKASDFEYKLLRKALEEGPERLAETVRHLTPQQDQRFMMCLADQAQKILPFVLPDQVLSDWAIKQINKYFVKCRLRGDSEIKLHNMVESMTDSFVINALIEATKNDDDWELVCEHIRNNFKKTAQTAFINCE